MFSSKTVVVAAAAVACMSEQTEARMIRVQRLQPVARQAGRQAGREFGSLIWGNTAAQEAKTASNKLQKAAMALEA